MKCQKYKLRRKWKQHVMPINDEISANEIFINIWQNSLKSLHSAVINLYLVVLILSLSNLKTLIF